MLSIHGSRWSVFALVTILSASLSSAFAPPSLAEIRTSKLHLRPDQGAELALAFENIIQEDDGSSNSATALHEQQNHRKQPLLRQFWNRLVHGSHRRWHQWLLQLLHIQQQQKQSNSNNNANTDEDIVLYPILGLTWVRDRPNHSQALPTTSRPSIMLRPSQKDQVEVGWYRAASDEGEEANSHGKP